MSAIAIIAEKAEKCRDSPFRSLQAQKIKIGAVTILTPIMQNVYDNPHAETPVGYIADAYASSWSRN